VHLCFKDIDGGTTNEEGNKIGEFFQVMQKLALCGGLNIGLQALEQG